MRTFFDRKKFPHFVNFSHLRGKSISFYLSFLYEAIIIKLMCYVYYSGAILYYIPLLVPSGPAGPGLPQFQSCSFLPAANVLEIEDMTRTGVV